MMVIICRYLTLLILTGMPNITNAQEKAPEITFAFGVDTRWSSITKDSSFKVHIDDQVKDGCWTTSNSAKTAVELELQRSGYKLADDEYSDINIFLTANGYGLNNNLGACVVVYQLEVYVLDVSYIYGDGHELSSLYNNQLWMVSGVLSGGKDEIANPLKVSFVDAIQEFLVNIERQKQKIRKAVIEVANENAGAKTLGRKLFGVTMNFSILNDYEYSIRRI